jgi:Spy/CpxP family protein refolding chaperone
MKIHLTRAVGLALALGTLSGCGSATLLEASALGLDTLLQARGTGVAGLRGGDAKGGPRGGEMASGPREGMHHGKRGGHGEETRGEGPMGEQRLFEGLDLTAEQRTQLQAIAEKHRPAEPASDAGQKPEHPGQKLPAILTAATLDVEALQAALAEKPPARPPHAEHHAAQLAEMRAVLTADQIAQLVARLEARPAKAAKRPEPPAGAQRPDPAARLTELATRLNLNAEQQAALQAFHAAMEANRPDRDEATRQAKHEAHRAAMVAFWKSGDASQLDALKPAQAEPPAFPAEALITLAKSLSAEQRQQLFAHGLPGGPGMHGPKGGPRMHGPRGGHEMRGPHGGHDESGSQPPAPQG